MNAQALQADQDGGGATALPDLASIEREMLTAHERSDHFSLVELYRQAAKVRFAEGNVDAGCFYLTHAYVFALETGHSIQDEIRAVLALHGREPTE